MKLCSCVPFNDDVPGKATSDADPRAQQTNDQWVALADHFDFAPDAEAHGHQPVQRVIGVFDMADDTARASRQFA